MMAESNDTRVRVPANILVDETTSSRDESDDIDTLNPFGRVQSDDSETLNPPGRVPIDCGEDNKKPIFLKCIREQSTLAL